MQQVERVAVDGTPKVRQGIAHPADCYAEVTLRLLPQRVVRIERHDLRERIRSGLPVVVVLHVGDGEHRVGFRQLRIDRDRALMPQP
jgi:hypothetical protein